MSARRIVKYHIMPYLCQFCTPICINMQIVNWLRLLNLNVGWSSSLHSITCFVLSISVLSLSVCTKTTLKIDSSMNENWLDWASFFFQTCTILCLAISFQIHQYLSIPRSLSFLNHSNGVFFVVRQMTAKSHTYTAADDYDKNDGGGGGGDGWANECDVLGALRFALFCASNSSFHHCRCSRRRRICCCCCRSIWICVWYDDVIIITCND